jgi:hypothetical protein
VDPVASARAAVERHPAVTSVELVERNLETAVRARLSGAGVL